MQDLTYTAAFSAFGAVPTNVQWSVSAIADDGAVVLAIWDDLFEPGPQRGTIAVRDQISKWTWSGPGKPEFIRHLTLARDEHRAVRCIIVTPKPGTDMAATQRGKAHHITPKVEWAGEVEFFDGDTYHLIFRKAP